MKITKEIKIMSLGSCFSQEIGRRMYDDGWNIHVNPFGILFNPISIYNSINLLCNDYVFGEKDVVDRDPRLGGFTSFHHHGSFTRPTPEEFIANANESLCQSRIAFAETQWLFITFGTAWVFRHLEKDMIVSNCHKHLASEFRREFFEVEDIVNLYSNLIESVEADPLFNGKKWLFTVSPIRHLKDGLHGNQISKATLLLAIERLQKKYPDLVYYFPSYEIVLDELRDYSHYAEDKVHPSAETIDYIYKKLMESFRF